LNTLLSRAAVVVEKRLAVVVGQVDSVPARVFR
jgi:hypothetical protein